MYCFEIIVFKNTKRALGIFDSLVALLEHLRLLYTKSGKLWITRFQPMKASKIKKIKKCKLGT